MDRVESGPIKFGNDWRGLFIRGDNALDYAYALRTLLETVQLDIVTAPVASLLAELESAHERSDTKCLDLKSIEDCKL